MTSIKLCNECSQVETQFYKVRLFEPQMTAIYYKQSPKYVPPNERSLEAESADAKISAAPMTYVNVNGKYK
jgi:hypothetical protein